MNIRFSSRYTLRSIGAALGAAAFAWALPASAAVVGTGTAGSCTEAALDTALSGGGVVTFNCGGPATIVLTTTKTLTTATAIDGGGLITLDGNLAVRHFTLTNPVSYSLVGLNLVNGRTASDGGAIFVNGATVLVNNVTLSGNAATGPSSRGGAIFSANGAAVTLSSVRAVGNQAAYGGAIFTGGPGGSLLLSEFVAQGNQAVQEGGAIEHQGSTLNVQQSLFTGNSFATLGGSGGGILIDPIGGPGSFAIANTTFQGNSGVSGGVGSGLAVLNASGTVNNTTFAGNGSAASVLDAFGSGASVTLRNTIVSGATGVNNCRALASASIVDGGNNLQFGGNTAQSCGASIPVADPLLGPLANNGGFSQTMALLAGSPAIDAGSACAAQDQRGVARPIGPACDIGAYEAPLPGPGGAAVGIPALPPAGLAFLAVAVAGLGVLRRRRAARL